MSYSSKRGDVEVWRLPHGRTAGGKQLLSPTRRPSIVFPQTQPSIIFRDETDQKNTETAEKAQS